MTEELKNIILKYTSLYNILASFKIQACIPNWKVDYDKKLSGNNFFLEEEFYKFNDKNNGKDLE